MDEHTSSLVELDETREACTRATDLYQIAMSEYLERMKQRDQILLFFAGAAGAIASLWLSASGANRSMTEPVKLPIETILLVIPYLAGVSGMMMTYHSKFIHGLTLYCDEHISPRIGPLPSLVASAGVARSGVLLRALSYAFILLAPSTFALFIAWSVAHWLSAAAYLFSVAGTVSVVRVAHKHWLHLKRQDRKRFQAPSPKLEPAE